MARKKTLEEIVAYLAIHFPSVSVLSKEYIGAIKDLDCFCKICNKPFKQRWNRFQQGAGCQLCGQKQGGLNARRTLKGIKEELKNISSTIKINSKEYMGSDKPLDCTCLICNYDWNPIWDTLKSGAGCPSCAGNLPVNIDDIRRDMLLINNGIEILRVARTTDGRNGFEVKCLIDGHVWVTVARSLKAGHGCRKCAGTLNLTLKEVKDTIYKTSPTIIIKSKEYINAYSKLDCECDICGHEWNPTYQDLYSGYGCPRCALENTGWTKTKWIRGKEKSNESKTFKVYIIKCYDELTGETFYKIGKTHTTIKARYHSNKIKTKSLPYFYKEVRIIESQNGALMWDLERHLLRAYNDFKSTPKIKFAGYTECFYDIPDLEKVIKEVISND